MGNVHNCVIYVYTGDRKNAGTDAKVSMVLHDEAGNESEAIHLNKILKNDFEKGGRDIFEIPEELTKRIKKHGKITKVQFWRDDAGMASDWYLEKIMVENRKTNNMSVFPVLRWIKPYRHYFINHLDTSLPQDDQHKQLRKMELEDKRNSYRFTQIQAGVPVQVETLPPDEQFSFDYKWDFVARGTKMMAMGAVKKAVTGPLKSIEDFNDLYDDVFTKPRGASRWKNDLFFGLQRVCGINCRLIELCTVLPEKFPVTDAMLGPLLKGLTIQQALHQKRLFICDLKILDGVPCKPGHVLCAPIALFFVDKDNQLRPVAIQLHQNPGPHNPIFLPTDDPWLWELVKIWYNNAEVAHHQAHAHLGFTHLIMEGVAITTHRQLSQSHPVFKLLAPHFLYLLAINSMALTSLVSEGGWVDTYTTFAVKGAYEIIRRGLFKWRLDTDGTLPADLKRRGLDDPNVLPCYHFRDDALLYYNAIRKYVTSYLHLYYDTPEKLTGDEEIQNWAAELVKPRDNDKGGCGLLGVPGEGSLTNIDQLATILTSVIYTGSVEHTAVNFSQYDEYGYPPNYPALLSGHPPTSKEPCTEKDLLKVLPDLSSSLGIMVITYILSEKGTNSLGDFEVQYVFDPKALKVVEEFRADIRGIGETIKARNTKRTFPFVDLEPDDIPNAISI